MWDPDRIVERAEALWTGATGTPDLPMAVIPVLAVPARLALHALSARLMLRAVARPRPPANRAEAGRWNPGRGPRVFCVAGQCGWPVPKLIPRKEDT